MIELVLFCVFYIGCGIALLYRAITGPTMADRIVAVDTIDVLAVSALVLISLFTGRGIYLDIAIVVGLFGFLGTVFMAKYLEGKL